MNELISENKFMGIRTAKTYFNKAYEYKGNHPIEEHQHYENLMAEIGLYEAEIVDVEITSSKIIITYLDRQ